MTVSPVCPFWVKGGPCAPPFVGVQGKTRQSRTSSVGNNTPLHVRLTRGPVPGPKVVSRSCQVDLGANVSCASRPNRRNPLCGIPRKIVFSLQLPASRGMGTGNRRGHELAAFRTPGPRELAGSDPFTSVNRPTSGSRFLHPDPPADTHGRRSLTFVRTDHVASAPAPSHDENGTGCPNSDAVRRPPTHYTSACRATTRQWSVNRWQREAHRVCSAVCIGEPGRTAGAAWEAIVTAGGEPTRAAGARTRVETRRSGKSCVRLVDGAAPFEKRAVRPGGARLLSGFGCRPGPRARAAARSAATAGPAHSDADPGPHDRDGRRVVGAACHGSAPTAT
jgi:hypothetical protein